MSLSNQDKNEIAEIVTAALAFTQSPVASAPAYIPQIRVESRPAKSNPNKMVDWLVTSAGQIPFFLVSDHINGLILKQKKEYLDKLRAKQQPVPEQD